ncbi:MAG: family 43 glycosylhydrolase [Christensenellaceae bacterium]
MVRILCYTKKGNKKYSDVLDCMHLALENERGEFIPLRNDTGVLFAKAAFDEGDFKGTTKTLADPFLFLREDGSFGVVAVRRNEAAPDSVHKGDVLLFASRDLIRYEEEGFLHLADSLVSSPKIRYEEAAKAYYVEWTCQKETFSGYTRNFKEVYTIEKLDRSRFEDERSAYQKALCSKDAENAVIGNAISVSDEAAGRIREYLAPIFHTAVQPICTHIAQGEAIKLPKAVCVYSDGSTHEKFVDWSKEELSKIDFSVPGTYTIHGTIRQKSYPFPLFDENISDPCLVRYEQRYFLSGSGSTSVKMRIADTVDGIASAEPVTLWEMDPKMKKTHANMWAPEMHVIKGVPYIFTTVGGKKWYTVRAHVLRCNGDPAVPKNWEAPRLVVRPDGTELNPEGISLDMTYFCVDGVHYVMWSNRIMHGKEGEPADVQIATIGEIIVS